MKAELGLTGLAGQLPQQSRLWFKLRGEQGSGPEGVDDLCSHTYGGQSLPPPPPLSPSSLTQILASRLKSQP